MDFAERNLEGHIPTLLSVWRDSGAIPVKFQGGAKYLSQKELSQASRSLLNLQRGLTGDRNLAGAGYMQQKDFLGAYLLYYWPVSFMQISYAANHALSKKQLEGLLEKKHVRILDIGSGPGPASSALIDLLKSRGVETFQVTLLDSSTDAMNLAQKIVNRDFGSFISFRSKKVNLEKEGSSIKQLLCDGDGNCEFDVIVMSHALNELWKKDQQFIQKRTKFLETTMELLSSDGMMLLCEPALLETSRSLLEVRDALLKQSSGKEKIRVVSPCVHAGDFGCPALSAGKGQTCHGEVMWNPCKIVSSIAQAAGLDRTSVKMTYVALMKEESAVGETDRESSPEKNATVTGVVSSDPMLNKAGRIRFVICNSRERITVSAKKDDPVAKEKGFFNLHRLDSVVIENAEVRGDASNVSYGIGSETKITAVPFAPQKN